MGHVAEHVRLLGNNSGTASASVTVVTTFAAQPAGTLLMAFVSTGRKSSTIGPGGPNTPPAGWTLLVAQYQYPAGQDHSYHVMAKVADGTETSLTVTSNTSSVVAEQNTTVAGIDAIVDAGFPGFADMLQGPTAINNTAVTAHLDTAAMVAAVGVNVRIDVVGGNKAVSTGFTGPSPAPSEVVTLRNIGGSNDRGAFGVFAYADDVAAGATSASRRYTASANRPQSINSFLCRVTPLVRWRVGSIGFG